MNTQTPDQTDDIDLEGFETPEEDFQETPEAVQEDADFQDVSDELDTDVFGEEQPAEPPAKKKINWFNIGVAVVATAVAGGLIWSKLGPQIMGGGDGMVPVASAPADASPVAVPVNKAGSEAAAQAAVGSSLGGTAVGTALLENPDQFANLSQSPAPSAAVSPAATATDPFAALGSAAPALPMPAPISGTPAPAADTAQKPAEQAVAAAAPQQPQAAVEAPKVVSAEPLPGPAAAESSSNDGALKAQVSALEQKLEALDSKISAAVEQIGTAAPVAAPVDDARLSSIQSALARLESRLDDLSSNRRPVDVSVDEPAPKKTVKKSSKPKVAAKSQSKWDQPYSPQPSAAPAAAAQSVSAGSGGWSLRGAQTGRAVIAKGADLREVAVGEVVPGLGEITGIANMGGRWVVQGTQGRLSQ